jgi:hypothetical protein
VVINVARCVIQCVLKSRCVSKKASYDVASSFCQANRLLCHPTPFEPSVLSYMTSYDVASSVCTALLLGDAAEELEMLRAAVGEGETALAAARAEAGESTAKASGLQRELSIIAATTSESAAADLAAAAEHSAAGIELERLRSALASKQEELDGASAAYTDLAASGMGKEEAATRERTEAAAVGPGKWMTWWAIYACRSFACRHIACPYIACYLMQRTPPPGIIS